MSRGQARRKTRRPGARGERVLRSERGTFAPPHPAASAAFVSDPRAQRRWRTAVTLLVVGTLCYAAGTVWMAAAQRNLIAMGLFIVGILVFAVAIAIGLTRFAGLPTEGPTVARWWKAMWTLLIASLVLGIGDWATHGASDSPIARVLHLAWMTPLAWYSVISSRLLRPRARTR